MKIYNDIYFSNLSINKEIRSDFKFYNWYNKNTLSFPQSMRLKEFISDYYKGYAFESDDFQKTGDIYAVKGVNFSKYLTLDKSDIEYLSKDFYADVRFDRFKIKKKDVLISLVGSIGKMAIIDNNVTALLNQNNIGIRFKEEYNYKVYAYVLKFVLDDMIKMLFDVSGYSFLRVDDLLNVKLPILAKEEQNELYKVIVINEREINKREPLIKTSSIIIDEIMRNSFDYGYEKFGALKCRNYYSSISQFSNNVDTRFSAKFHRPAGEFVYQELLNRPNKKIKKCLVLPMITGQGIETTDYDESGDYAYVSMADISSWELDLSNVRYVSNDYANRKLTKKIKGLKNPVSTEIAVNDIVMMRSGEGGIGKVAIIKDNIKGIFCDFIIRMRFDESIINPEFAYFYFRSKYFQYLVEINKKGLGNNTNIFPNQLQEFPIPDLPLSEQQEIVDMINAEIDKQKKIEKEIEEKKAEIERMINLVLR